jgi:hypothetical protein
MSNLSLLERRIIAAEKLGESWAELHAVWLQLDDAKKNVLAGLMNDLDDGEKSEAKLERLARGAKEYKDYCTNLALAKGAELRAKVKYECAKDWFEAGRSAESTERAKLTHFNHIP